jgi:hypothetical protein
MSVIDPEFLDIPPNPPTPHQPVLPDEVTFTEAELVFMDESPPGLFPENQDSNFGFIIRKIFSDLAQDIANWQDIIYNEHFVNTSSRFLDQWEIELDLPAQPPGYTMEARRAAVTARIQRGPFTRGRRDELIRKYVQSTYGTVIQLVPQGVPIDATGVPIYGEAADTSSLFQVFEDQPNFQYTVWIAATNSPNLADLTRELKRITPAGIRFTITNVHP